MENNKQQTTLQTLIDGLVATKANIIQNKYKMPEPMLAGGVLAFDSAIDFAKSLLEKEKEKLELAYYEGLIDAMNSRPKNYYEQTYGGGKQ